MTHTICHCDLSGEIYVIDDDAGGCEVCRPAERSAITPKNVQKALKWYQDRIEEIMKVHRQSAT